MGLPRLGFWLSVVGILSACGSDKPTTETSRQKALAKVNENTLFLEDVLPHLPPKSTAKDSIAFLQSFTNQWIRKELLFTKAQKEIQTADPEIEQRITDYKYSLYTYALKNKLIKEKLDTTVSSADIKSYYEKEISNFLLQEPIFKLFILKMNLSPSQEKSIRRSMPSLNWTVDSTWRANMVAQTIHDGNLWLEADQWGLPITISIPKTHAEVAQVKERMVRDKEFVYLLKIMAFRPAMEPAPLEFVEDKIKAIIINKRKLELANALEEQLYNEAFKENKVETYL